jgi:pimeloyl-ACP methyl ester carboxylesterase
VHVTRTLPTLAFVVAVTVAASAPLVAAPGKLPLATCGPAGARAEILCGTLAVPEDPARPQGRQVVLDVVVLPALEGLGTGGAMFQLEGGPGLAASDSRDFYLAEGREYRRGRDVVLADQRGAGHGPRALRCARLEARTPLDDDYGRAAVDECRAELERRVDLTQYSTWIAAGDVDAVRAALGYERIDLWALSYGTKLAQVYLKRFPDRVRTAFLIGTVALDYQPPLFHAAVAQRALDGVFFDCQMDAACRGAFPGLRADWQRVLARLDGGPVQVTVPKGEKRGEKTPERTVEVRRGAFVEAVRGLLAVTESQRKLPRLIHAAAAGDFVPLVTQLGTGPSPFAEGLYLSVTCAEGSARIDPATVPAATAGTFLGDYRVRGELDACSRWPKATLPEGFFTPATAGAPVLVVSGGGDHVAAPEWSDEVCAKLPKCRLVRVPHLGHAPFDVGAWKGGDCVDRLALDLFARGNAETVDASCVAAMVPPPFAVN